MSGARAKISGILPASLRAGIITETEGRLARDPSSGSRPGDDEIGQGEVFERPEFDQKTVEEISQQSRNGSGQKNFLRLLDHLTVGKIREAGDVLYSQPVLIQCRLGQIQPLGQPLETAPINGYKN